MSCRAVPRVRALVAPACLFLLVGAASAQTQRIVENPDRGAGPARWFAPGGLANVWFTPDSVVIDRAEAAAGDSAGPGEPPDHGSRPARGPRHLVTREHRRSVRLGFLGGAADAVATPEEALPGGFSWLRGRDPALWVTGACSWAAVVYHEVWPGIDLVFRIVDGRLAWRARLAPGADPGRIRLSVEGEPGVPKRLSGGIEGAWALGGGATAPAPAPAAARLFWSTFLGGAGGDYAGSLTLDAAGAVYVTGETRSAGFPSVTGAYDTSADGAYDIFAAKLDPSGSQLLWATFLGGSGNDFCYSAVLDGQNRLALAGHTESANFPTTAGAFDRTLRGPGDALVARLSADGRALLVSTLIGGGGDDLASDLALDGSGNFVITGFTGSADFPIGAGAPFPAFGGGNTDAFVAKVAAGGGSLAWGTFLGGQYNDYGEALAIAANGDIVVAGNTGSPDFPTSSGAFSSRPGGSDDAFVARLAASGRALVWSTYLGGSGFDQCSDFVLDLAGNPLVTGTTYSPDFPTTSGAVDRVLSGSHDAFVSRLDADGGSLMASTYLGGSGGETAYALAVDPLSSAIVAGETDSADFPTVAGAFDRTYNGGLTDAFVTKISPGGQRIVWSTLLGGSGDESSYAVLLGPAGDVFTAGGTNSVDFPVTALSFDAAADGQMDAFVTRFFQPRPVGVAPDGGGGPAGLLPASPAPGDGEVKVRFRLDAPGEVRLRLFDARGRGVRDLAPGMLPVGEHAVTWDGRDARGARVAAGVYLCRLECGNFLSSGRIILVR